MLTDLPGDCEVLDEITLEDVQQRTNQDVNVSVVNNPAHWDQVLGMLDAQEAVQGEDDPPRPPGGVHPQAPQPNPEVGPVQPAVVIPVTEMRYLYSVLEDFNSIEFHLAMAHETERAPVPRRLAQRFGASVRKFGSYDNVNEPFHPDRPDLPAYDQQVDQPQHIPNTDDLTMRLVQQQGGVGTVVNDPSLNFRFVDREIMPARTTGRAFYANGVPATHGKKLDWLLANATDNRLVIGEIKIRNDSNPFYALIQSLMYTAELVTDHQIQRLNTYYRQQDDGNPVPDPPQEFEFAEDPDLGRRLAPRADIYVILCGYNWAGTMRQEIFDSFQRICEVLVQEPVLADHVRRIACLDVQFNNNRELQFFKLFSYPQAAD
jgi:hypothetical protein